MAGFDQALHRDRQKGFQADDAEGGLVELAELLLGGVRGVVGGEDLDRAVLEAADHRLDVVPGAQGRAHLVVGVEAPESLVGESEVVRARLGGDADPPPLAFANELDGACGRDVLDVEPAAGDLGEADVAGNHDVFGRGRHSGQAQLHRLEPLVHHAADGQLGHLAVLHDHAVKHLRVFERPPHQRGRGHRRAVVGESDRAARDKLAKLGEFFPLASLAHRADGIHMGLPRPLSLKHDELGGALRVDRGDGVGHAGDRGHAARERGLRSGGDRLVLLVAGLAEVDVEIDQAGADDQAVGVDHDLGFLVRPAAEGQHATPADPEIADPVEVLAGVDDSAAGDLDRPQCRRPHE